MSTSSGRSELDRTLAAVADSNGEPVTAPELADALDCTRRTAYNRLQTLVDRGLLETKKVGARGRVWWRPPDATSTPPAPDTPDQREQALRELHDASRRLMRADTHVAVYAIAVEAAERVLGLSMNGLWVRAADRPVLEPIEWTESGVEEYGTPPSFPLEGSLVGDVYTEGTYRVYEDITTESGVYDPDTAVRSELILPLGEHGVLNASSPEPATFDAVDVSLGRILAANVETALDRADQLEQRRARRRELERLNQLTTLVQETIAALVGMATRPEIERTVCDRLADSGFYTDAWIVGRDGTTGDLVVRRGPSMADPRTEEPIPVPAPIERALDDRTPVVLEDCNDHDRLPEAVRSGLDAVDASSCVIVPLTHTDTEFGALVISAGTSITLGDRERRAFDTLGRVVGFVVHATNNRQLLLGNTAIELTVEIGGEVGWLLPASMQLEGPMSLHGLVRDGSESVIVYLSVADETASSAASRLEEFPATEATRVVSGDRDAPLLECRLREPAVRLTAITDYGASLREATATAGEGRLTLRFPPATTAREAMGVVREAYSSAELRAKRVTDVSDRSATTIRRTIADQLTDRQATALRAALLAGYYESPRDTTASELASSLEIAPSTLYEHLQAAHRRILETVFDDASNGS